MLNTDGAPKERSTPRSQIHSTTDADSDPDWEFSVQNNVIQNAGRVMPEKRTISGEARVQCSTLMARQSSQSHVLICATSARGTAIAGHRAQHEQAYQAKTVKGRKAEVPRAPRAHMTGKRS